MGDGVGLEQRYSELKARIGGAATLVAVSKTQAAEAVEALYRLGHRDFGENYAQELVAKAAVLRERGCTGIRWHFIGHLQSNKASLVAGLCASVHSVDSERLARELSKRRVASGAADPLDVFLEVNIDGEESKAGVAPDPGTLGALASAVAALPGLRLVGLMTVPSAEGDSASAFRRLRVLEAGLGPLSQRGLSMGMTADFEAALAEGSTHVRVGTALFGARAVAG